MKSKTTVEVSAQEIYALIEEKLGTKLGKPRLVSRTTSLSPYDPGPEELVSLVFETAQELPTTNQLSSDTSRGNPTH